MLRKLLTTVLLLCATVFVSHATYVVTALTQSIVITNGLACATVEVTLTWHEVDPLKGVVDVVMGRGTMRVGPGCGLIPPFPNNNPACPEYTFHDMIVVTDPTSPTCASVWLNYPGVDAMVVATLDEALAEATPQNRAALGIATSAETATDQLQVFPSPANNMITVRAQSKDLIDAEIVIHDATGKMVDSGHTIRGSRPVYSFTMNVSNFARGIYTASIVLKNGQKVFTRFSVQ